MKWNERHKQHVKRLKANERELLWKAGYQLMQAQMYRPIVNLVIIDLEELHRPPRRL
jgi:hypothetical protein